MNLNLTANEPPHVKSTDNTRKVMLTVITALLPAVITGTYFFGLRALLLIAVCVSTCVASEFLIQRLRGVETTTGDLSAVLTGLLLALVLPPGLPLWAAVLGAVVSIFLGKQLFGGLGSNIFNPALIGRAFLTATFPVMMTAWIKPFNLEAVTTATPLGLMKFEGVGTPVSALFMGNTAGCIGETSAIALILGGIFLLFRKAADWRIPLGYLSAVIACSLFLNCFNPSKYPSVDFEILAGGLLIGAIFMATDPATSPVTKKGRWIYAVGCGLITMIIRRWGGLPEGVMYSILFMNALRPLIDRNTRPVCFGGAL